MGSIVLCNTGADSLSKIDLEKSLFLFLSMLSTNFSHSSIDTDLIIFFTSAIEVTDIDNSLIPRPSRIGVYFGTPPISPHNVTSLLLSFAVFIICFNILKTDISIGL